MEDEKLKDNDQHEEVSKSKLATSTHIVTTDAVEAEDMPTIPLASLEMINALEPEVSIHSITSTQTVSTPEPLVVQPSEYRRSVSEWLQIWWDGIRPTYLLLSLMPVLLGSVLAWTQTVTPKMPLGQFRLVHFLGALIIVVLIQIGAHLVNDYYDYIRGIDTANLLASGGLIQQGLIKPTRILTYGLALLGSGALLGLLVAFPGGPLVYLFGLLGLLCAFFYSATARALSSLALGELVSFVVFGPLIFLGAYLVQAGSMTRSMLIYSIPLGLLAAAAIHVNNMRDTESDALAGKRTIASLLGLEWSKAWFLVLLLGAYIVIAVLGIPRGAQHLILITFWTLPTAVVAASGILRTDSAASLDQVLRQVLKLQMFFALLLLVALIVSALIPVLPRMPNILPI